MIGIGVGIDYALFIVTRYREALHRTNNPEAAVLEAMTTSGRAVVFAGFTVMVSRARHAPHGPQLPARARGRHVARRRDRGRWPRSRCCPRCSGSSGFTIDKLKVGRRKPEHAARACGTAGRAPCSGAPARSRSPASRCSSSSRCRCCRCASAAPTPATTRPARPPTRRTTSSPTGFGPGANGPILVVANTAEARAAAAAAEADPGAALDARGRVGHRPTAERGRHRGDRDADREDRSAGRDDRAAGAPPARRRRPRGHRRARARRSTSAVRPRARSTSPT